MVETQTKNQNIFWLWSDEVDCVSNCGVLHWMPIYVELDKRLTAELNTGKAKKLKDIAFIDYGFMPLEDYTTPNLGKALIRVTNIKGDGIIEMEDVKYVPINDRVRGKLVREGDSLIVQCGNTTGKIGFITKELEGLIYPSFCLLARPKEINPYVLNVILSSSVVQTQLQRGMDYSSVRPNTTKPEVENFIIPTLKKDEQLEIEQLTKIAFQLKKDAEADYQRSQQLLNEALGLSGIKKEQEIAFWRWSNEVDIVARIDPNYYQKYFQEMQARMARVKTIKLEKLASLIDYGTVPTSPDAPPEFGTPYLTGKNIQPNELVLEKLDYLYTDTTQGIKDKAIEAGDVLITQMGTVGNAAVMGKDQKGWFFGSFLIRVRPNKNVSPEWLALVVNSDFGKQQIQQTMTTATVRTNTDLPTIKGLEIPIISKKKEEEIVDLYIQSRNKKALSKQKLQEAKDFVENLIRNQ